MEDGGSQWRSSTLSSLDPGFESARSGAGGCERVRLHLFGTRFSTAAVSSNGHEWLDRQLQNLRSGRDPNSGQSDL